MDYTFFKNMNITLRDIIFILYYYFQEDISYRKLLHELDLNSSSTISKLLQIIRKSVTEWGKELNKRKIDGPEKIVELDESCIYRGKNNQGRILEQQWIIGGICRNDKRFFFEIIPNRDRLTIGDVVTNHVTSGSLVFTDEWRSYPSAIQRVPGCTHYKVNHSKNFVSPEGIHTQTIECMWGCFKRWMRKRSYDRGDRNNLICYISEYIVRKEGVNFIDFINKLNYYN